MTFQRSLTSSISRMLTWRTFRRFEKPCSRAKPAGSLFEWARKGLKGTNSKKQHIKNRRDHPSHCSCQVKETYTYWPISLVLPSTRRRTCLHCYIVTKPVRQRTQNVCRYPQLVTDQGRNSIVSASVDFCWPTVTHIRYIPHVCHPSSEEPDRHITSGLLLAALQAQASGTFLKFNVYSAFRNFFPKFVWFYKNGFSLDFPQIFRKDSLCPQQAQNLFFGVQR